MQFRIRDEGRHRLKEEEAVFLWGGPPKESHGLPKRVQP